MADPATADPATTDDVMVQLEDRLDEIPLEIDHEGRGLAVDANGWAHNLWSVTITRTDNGNSIHTPYRTGLAILTPTLYDVLDSLLLDASAAENSNGYQDFLAEFGLENSKESWKIYSSCLWARDKLMDFLGDRYNDWVFNTDY